MGDESRLTEKIDFRVTKEEKEELTRVAEENNLTIGEIMRKALDTIPVLFDEELTLARLIEMAGVLKRNQD